MGVINIVKSYPEIFGRVKTDLDEEDAWRIIASTSISGSIRKKNSISIHDRFCVVQKLFKIGLGEVTAEIAIETLKQAINQKHYSIAQQLCELLLRYSHQNNDLESAHKYDSLYRIYHDINELEYQSLLKVGELLIKHESGLEFDELEIIRSLQFIEEKLPFEGIIYHYYYFSFQLMISSNSDYEAKLQNAIAYFKNQYDDHNDYLSSFVLKLIVHYRDAQRYRQVEVLLHKYIDKCKEGSKPWFKYLKATCIYYLSIGDVKNAKIYIIKSFHNMKFYNLPDDEKKEWNEINFEIQAKLRNDKSTKPK